MCFSGLIFYNFHCFTSVKLDDLDRALSSFDKSMNLAKSLDDEAAQNAISKAIRDLKSQMETGLSKFCLQHRSLFVGIKLVRVLPLRIPEI